MIRQIADALDAAPRDLQGFVKISDQAARQMAQAIRDHLDEDSYNDKESDSHA